MCVCIHVRMCVYIYVFICVYGQFVCLLNISRDLLFSRVTFTPRSNSDRLTVIIPLFEWRSSTTIWNPIS